MVFIEHDIRNAASGADATTASLLVLWPSCWLRLLCTFLHLLKLGDFACLLTFFALAVPIAYVACVELNGNGISVDWRR